jgi:hypothetical protein
MTDPKMSRLVLESCHIRVDLLCAAAVAEEAFDWVFLVFFGQFPFQGVTFVGFWFVANRGRGKGLGGKVTQLILNLIVA